MWAVRRRRNLRCGTRGLFGRAGAERRRGVCPLAGDPPSPPAGSNRTARRASPVRFRCRVVQCVPGSAEQPRADARFAARAKAGPWTLVALPSWRTARGSARLSWTPTALRARARCGAGTAARGREPASPCCLPATSGARRLVAMSAMRASLVELVTRRRPHRLRGATDRAVVQARVLDRTFCAPRAYMGRSARLPSRALARVRAASGRGSRTSTLRFSERACAATRTRRGAAPRPGGSRAGRRRATRAPSRSSPARGRGGHGGCARGRAVPGAVSRPSGEPLVSVIIPTRDRRGAAAGRVASVLERSG